MLKNKLFKGFAILVIIFAAISAFISLGMIKSQVVEEAQRRVRLDLSSAWSVYNARLNEISLVVNLAASKKIIVEACGQRKWENSEMQSRLEIIRANFGLDFLSLIAPDGKVMLRTAPPYHTGDYRISDSLINKALAGESASGTTLFSKVALAKEGDGFIEKAFLQLENTPRARTSPKGVEDRGMMMLSACPVKQGREVLAVMYGGILLNRDHQLVDRIKDIVYRQEAYNDMPLGTTTIFIGDSRVATTVRQENGNRAIGTRVSKEVADRVLDNGLAWVGRAFVVKDWYLTAYDPIRDGRGKIIGMLYVGILEKPFHDLQNKMISQYIALAGFGLLAALLLAFVLAGRLSRPIHRLVDAIHEMRYGRQPEPIPVDNASQETRSLTIAFNEMASVLAERESSLIKAQQELEQTNTSLTTTNHNYMESLGFVAHELKSPISSMMNYVYLIKEQKIGPLTERQIKAITSVDSNLRRIVEMIRHYLNLSRIENSELQPLLAEVAVQEEIVTPILEDLAPDIEARGMVVANDIDATMLAYADMNMTHEIFENLISNAIKYGREGGKIGLTCQDAGDYLRFEVTNEGQGIEPEKITKMFQKFTRLENEGGKYQQRGTGLGLFITRHIIQAHGGEIEVTSEPGQWTRFGFTLPCFQQKKKETTHHGCTDEKAAATS